jgi:antitoxin VapB
VTSALLNEKDPVSPGRQLSMHISSGISRQKKRARKSSQSQAVRLPKEFRFDDDHVFVKKSGNAVVLIPAKNSWDTLIRSLDKFSDDFMSERKQPKLQKREDF